MKGWRVFSLLARCQSGAAAVEMALVLPAFLAFCLGTVEFGRMYWVRSSLQYAVEEAARFALAHPTATDQDLNDLTLERFGNVSYGIPTVTVTRETVGSDNYIIIDATYAFEFITQWFPSEPMTLAGRSRIPLS